MFFNGFHLFLSETIGSSMVFIRFSLKPIFFNGFHLFSTETELLRMIWESRILKSSEHIRWLHFQTDAIIKMITEMCVIERGLLIGGSGGLKGYITKPCRGTFFYCTFNTNRTRSKNFFFFNFLRF